MTQQLLGMGKAAAQLGIHPNTLRQWADKGLVAFIKLPSGYRRFRVEEIERLRRDMGLEDLELKTAA